MINTGPKSYPLRKVIDHDPVQDNDFMDFLERCLELDPDRRITPDEAMHHPWLKNTKQIFDLLHGAQPHNGSAAKAGSGESSKEYNNYNNP